MYRLKKAVIAVWEVDEGIFVCYSRWMWKVRGSLEKPCSDEVTAGDVHSPRRREGTGDWTDFEM